jgi:hypothetical protein
MDLLRQFFGTAGEGPSLRLQGAHGASMLGTDIFGSVHFLMTRTHCVHNGLADSEKFFMAPLKVLHALIRSSLEEASSMIHEPAFEHNHVRSH